MEERVLSVLGVGELTRQVIQVIEELKYKRGICHEQEIKIEKFIKEKLELESTSEENLNKLRSCETVIKKLKDDQKAHVFENLDFKNAEDSLDLRQQLATSNDIITGLKKEISELQILNHQSKSSLELSERKYKTLESSYDFMKEKVEHLQNDTKVLVETLKSLKTSHSTIKTNSDAILSINNNLSLLLKHKDSIYNELMEKRNALEEKITMLEADNTKFKIQFNDEENPKLESIKAQLKDIVAKYELLQNEYTVTSTKLKVSETALMEATDSIINSNKMVLEQSVLHGQIDDFKAKYQTEKLKACNLESQLKAAIEENLTVQKKLLVEEEKDQESLTKKFDELISVNQVQENIIKDLRQEKSSLLSKIKLLDKNIAELQLQPMKQANITDKTTQTDSSVSNGELGSNESCTQSKLEDKYSQNTNENILCGSTNKVTNEKQVFHTNKQHLQHDLCSVKTEDIDQNAGDCKQKEHKVLNNSESKITLHKNSDDVTENNIAKQKLQMDNSLSKYQMSVVQVQPVQRSFVGITNNVNEPNLVTKSSYAISNDDHNEKLIMPCNNFTATEMVSSKSSSETIFSHSNKQIKPSEGIVQSSKNGYMYNPQSPTSNAFKIFPVLPDSPLLQDHKENYYTQTDIAVSKKQPLISSVLQSKRGLSVSFSTSSNKHDGPKVISLNNSDSIQPQADESKQKSKKRKLESSPEMLEELDPCTQESVLSTPCPSTSNNVLSTVAKFSKEVKATAMDIKRRQSDKLSMRYCHNSSPVEINDLSDTENSEKDFIY